MSLSDRLFAAFYDLLNSVVEGRVEPQRRETAGEAWGDVLEIGGGTGANLGEARRVVRPGGSFLFYEHVVSQHGTMRQWQRRLNPAWRFATTGCNLDRDIAGAIRAAGFQRVELTSFDLSVGPPVTIPNIVGAATA